MARKKKESESVEEVKDKGLKAGKKSKAKFGFKMYVGVLMVISIAFAAHLLYSFYIQPRGASGAPIFGTRLDHVVEIPESVVTATKEFGGNQSRVESTNVKIIGSIVYFDVRVESGTGLEVARAAAEEIADFFLGEAGEDAEGYTIQLVVSKGNPEELFAENRAEMLDHVRLSQLEWLEDLTVFAETFPTDAATVGADHATIDRVLANISLLRRRTAYIEKIGEYYSFYEEALADFEARVNALTPLTSSEVETLVEQNNGELLILDITDIRDIPQSNIADFPSWGALNNETALVEWN